MVLCRYIRTGSKRFWRRDHDGYEKKKQELGRKNEKPKKKRKGKERERKERKKECNSAMKEQKLIEQASKT